MTGVPLPQSVTAVDLGGFRGDFLDLVFHAGPVVKGVLLILFLFSILSWAVIILKYRVIRAAQRESREFSNLFRETKELSAIYRASQNFSGSPLAHVFRSGFLELDRLRKVVESGGSGEKRDIGTIDRSLKRAVLDQSTRLERMLSFLATTGNATPFIGLFGTVWGIMDAFRQIGYRGSTSLVEETLEEIAAKGTLREGGMVVVEHEAKREVKETSGCLTLHDQRRYGQTGLSFFVSVKG